MTKTPAQILREARNMIDTPAKWSGGGWGCGATKCVGHAVTIAAYGSERAAWNWHLTLRSEAWRILSDSVECRSFDDYNDSHSYVEVMAALGRAIDLAEADEASNHALAERESSHAH